MDDYFIDKCCICEGNRSFVFEHLVLRKYPCKYYQCVNCGFLQVEKPYWLDEAYNSAIGRLDTGILSRNLKNSDVLSLLLPYLSRRRGKFLDIGGGYGILTRLMRDRGFDYYWSDKYCENLFANGFEWEDGMKYDVVSAFEIFEHIVDPIEFMADVIKKTGSKTIVFSTELFDGPPPIPNDWWYYVFDGGQHISFYQQKTLQTVANRFGLQFIAGKSIHVMTDKHLSRTLFRMLGSKSLALILSPFTRIFGGTKTMSDHHLLTRH